MSLRRRIALVVAGTALVSTACFAHHLRRNAPGDLERDSEAVRELETGARLRPGDPGERVVELLVGPTVEFGGPLEASGSSLARSPRIGGEISTHFYRTEHSHEHSVLTQFLGLDFSAVRRSFLGGGPTNVAPRVNLGSSYHTDREAWRVFAEGGLAYPGHLELTGGYTVEPLRGEHGVQATLALWGPIQTRYAHYFDGRNEVYVGFTLRSGQMFVWSR